MKYFIVSDIHGNLDKLTEALTANNFDAEKDTLISAGDAFDRGYQNVEVLHYLMSLPNKILLFGNHDLRLKHLIENPKSTYRAYDIQNGTVQTIYDIYNSLRKDKSFIYDHAIAKINQKTLPAAKELFEYFDLCKYCIEFKDLYITHAWLPTEWESPNYESYESGGYKLREDWRQASKEDWYDATWSNVEDMIRCKAYPDKQLVIGHWHTFRIAALFKLDWMHYNTSEPIKTEMFITPDKKLICLDGCTAIPDGRVNVYVYETNETPNII